MKTGILIGVGFLVLFLVGLFLFRKFWNKPKGTSVSGGGGSVVDPGKNDKDNQTT